MADFPAALTNAVDNVTDILAKQLNNLEAKVGTDNSAVTTSLDYMVRNANPVGAMLIWSTSTAPTGYILCDGDSLLRTGTYAALFAVISTTYGTVDGTHFNVPNLKGKYARGLDSSDTACDAMGETGGLKIHTPTAATTYAHTHDTNPASTASGTVSADHQHSGQRQEMDAPDGGSYRTANRPYGYGGDGDLAHAGYISANHTHSTDIGNTTSSTTGSSTAFPVLDPFITLTYIIKY